MIIEDAVVLITGAGRGLGLALVRALFNKSPRYIYAAIRNQEQLDDLIADYGDIVIPVSMDVTDTESINRVADLAQDVTLLINNAGVISEGDLFQAELDNIQREMDVNYFGTLNVIRRFTPIIEANGGGAVINILSISALASVPGIGGYSASKAASQSLTQSIRYLLQDKSITVHGVFPGPIDTDMTRDMDVRKATSDDVAQAIVEQVEQGEEDIFPDEMSRQGGLCWRSDPKVLERQLAMS